MNPNQTMLQLIRHEFKIKGRCSKTYRGKAARRVRLAYAAVILLFLAVVFAYHSYSNENSIYAVWYATIGFPFIVFFTGSRSVQREWHYDTYGFWLALPYPRRKLAAAKWAAACLSSLILVVLCTVALAVYAFILTAAFPSLTFVDWQAFMLSGASWMILIAGFIPLLTAAGMLLASWRFSVLGFAAPLLWIAAMAGIGSLYSLDFTGFERSLEGGQGAWFPHPWPVIAVMAASWLVSYAVMRITAYVLEHKLAL